MIPTRRAALAQSGNRFSDKIMLQTKGVRLGYNVMRIVSTRSWQ